MMTNGTGRSARLPGKRIGETGDAAAAPIGTLALRAKPREQPPRTVARGGETTTTYSSSSLSLNCAASFCWVCGGTGAWRENSMV